MEAKAAPKKKAATKKKFKQAVEDSMPQVKMPNDVGKDNWSKMEEYTDGFVITVAVTILGATALGLIWLLTK